MENERNALLDALHEARIRLAHVLVGFLAERLRDQGRHFGIADLAEGPGRGQAHVAVVGHTDSVGNEADNVVLSRARANTVAAKLTANGVPSARVHAEGYGSKQPIADNATDAGRAENRRVELAVGVR
jgi:ferredoxin-NADP reductase